MMRVDKEGLVYGEDGSLACEVNKLAKVVQVDILRKLGPGEVGFTKAEAEYFQVIVREQIKEFERKKHGEKGRKKAKKILEEVTSEEEVVENSED